MVSKAAEDVFIEKMGLFLETNSKFPRIAGKIYGYLLICRPAHQSAGDLVERLGIAKSSVSGMMRLLLQPRLVEEMTIPGVRPKYYRVRQGGWEDLFFETQSAIVKARLLFTEGLRLTDPGDDEASERIGEIDLLYEFYEKELPELEKRWLIYKARSVRGNCRIGGS